MAPVANLTAGYGESWDRSAKVKERSGIEAQDRLDGRVAGDTQLTGATLGSKSRQGDLATEGKTKAVALEDYREKDGGSGSANVGFGRSGLPSVAPASSYSSVRSAQISGNSTTSSILRR